METFNSRGLHDSVAESVARLKAAAEKGLGGRGDPAETVLARLVHLPQDAGAHDADEGGLGHDRPDPAREAQQG